MRLRGLARAASRLPRPPFVRLVPAAAVRTNTGSPGRLEPHLDLRRIRDNLDQAVRNCEERRVTADPTRVAQLYDEEVRLKRRVDELRAERNALAKSGGAKEEVVERGRALKREIGDLEVQQREVWEQLMAAAVCLPNETHPLAPVGPESAARVVGLVGEPVVFPAGMKAQDHLELAAKHGWVDFEAAARIAGPKFSLLKGRAALLEIALVQWAMTQVSERFGFTPVLPPDIAHHGVVAGCGFQPRGDESNIYPIHGTDFCLAATSEIAIAGMHAGQILDKKQFPECFVAFSHCFRREAGAHGAASKGLYRLHQFSKVEMFVVCPSDADGKGVSPPSLLHRVTSTSSSSTSPATTSSSSSPLSLFSPKSVRIPVRPTHPSDAYLADLVSIQTTLLADLGLHARVLEMPTEELGASAHRKIDVEAWMPGRQSFGEVTSASDCTDYQSRRLNIRYREGKETRFAHTLNATALAVPRVILSILETNQQPDGSVLIPEVLRPFLGGRRTL